MNVLLSQSKLIYMISNFFTVATRGGGAAAVPRGNPGGIPEVYTLRVKEAVKP